MPRGRDAWHYSVRDAESDRKRPKLLIPSFGWPILPYIVLEERYSLNCQFFLFHSISFTQSLYLDTRRLLNQSKCLLDKLSLKLNEDPSQHRLEPYVRPSFFQLQTTRPLTAS
jgi:hypothetical protein